jgi:hypothetical protein
MPRGPDGESARSPPDFSRPQAGRRQPPSSERRTQFPSPAPSPAPAAVVHKRRPGHQHPHRVLHRLIPRPGETRVDGFLRPCHRASARGLREGNGPRSVRGRQSAVQRPSGDLVPSASGDAWRSPATTSRFAARAANGQQPVDGRDRARLVGSVCRWWSHWPGRCIDNRMMVVCLDWPAEGIAFDNSRLTPQKPCRPRRARAASCLLQVRVAEVHPLQVRAEELRPPAGPRRRAPPLPGSRRRAAPPASSRRQAAPPAGPRGRAPPLPGSCR